ncbi:UNVERIFIED_ORG: transposase-like protein [Arthrobacter globiformis]|nr:transposase-like protein [Arthrobacter globiformis]
MAVVQTCIVHLVRNTFRYAARKCWSEMARDLRPVYTAPSESAAKERLADFSSKWGRQYLASIRRWENAWSEFVPFLDYDVEIRRVICSTNAIESVNARYRRAVRAARGHFPTSQAALKCLSTSPPGHWTPAGHDGLHDGSRH